MEPFLGPSECQMCKWNARRGPCTKYEHIHSNRWMSYLFLIMSLRHHDIFDQRKMIGFGLVLHKIIIFNSVEWCDNLRHHRKVFCMYMDHHMSNGMNMLCKNAVLHFIQFDTVYCETMSCPSIFDYFYILQINKVIDSHSAISLSFFPFYLYHSLPLLILFLLFSSSAFFVLLPF